MMCPHQAREEVANTLTHGAGLLASLVGAALLVPLAATGGPLRAIGVVVFCASLVLLYASSTFYHAVRHPTAKARLLILDHCAIFVLIAGSYTPFTLALGGTVGWGLFALVWGIAGAGIVLKLFFAGQFRILSTLLYVAMGWLVVLAIDPVLRAFPLPTLLWLLVGGLTYTAGTLFYLSDRRYAHAVWHLFVLGGSACHFAAVASHVAAV